jgi:DNA-binding response OmpR family regulator
MRILVVEDEPSMAELIHSALTDEGHQVALANRGDDGLSLGKTGQFELIVLDLMLPGMDGFTVSEGLRKARVQTPILVLTARDTNSDVVRVLDGGADDYLTKPFSLEVFLARVRAVSRRGSIPQPVCFEVGSLTLNTSSREVMRQGIALELTPREYSLLELLIRNKTRVVPRTKIVEAIWGWDSDIGENTVDVFIRSLRQKIELDGCPKLIRTVRGIGYCIEDRPL